MITTLENTHAVIRFGLKESLKSLENDPKKESLIMLHFTSKGRRFKKSIGYKCSYSQWESGRQRVKTNKGMMVNAYKVNDYINQIEAFTHNQISKMVSAKHAIDIDRLKYVVDCKLNNIEIDGKKKELQKLIPFAERYMAEKKSSIDITTYRACNQTLKMLYKFEKSTAKKITFEDIDMSFYRKFVAFLEEEDYSVNSIGKHIKNLKVFLNDALTNGLTQNVIFKSKNFKVLREVTTDIYLTPEEIQLLADKDFSPRPKIEQARDIFLIGCYTGQRVSDYNGLSEKNIEIIDGIKIIKIHQKKTDNPVHIPITLSIQQVMDRYNNQFPPKLSEPILRRNIKTACHAAGLRDEVQVSYTKGGKAVKKGVPKYKLVKTHTARRSFCTNYFIAGKPLQQIMLFSGHKTEREFMKYIRIEKKQEALAVMKSGFFD